MANKNDGGEVVQLKKIQRELVDIKQNTRSSGWFWHGMWQGAGAIVGSAIALLVVSVILYFLGVIPGFQDIATYLGTVISNIRY